MLHTEEISMRMIRLASAVALAAAFVTPAAAQIVVGGEPMQMLPPGGRQMKTGTGRIKGRLIAADTGNPVRRAQVRLSGPDVLPKSVTTDSDGRFEFKDLPPGAFSLNASKSGFVAVNYGQKRPFEPGKPIELVEGSRLRTPTSHCRKAPSCRGASWTSSAIRLPTRR
jgi:hypothetical protein